MRARAGLDLTGYYKLYAAKTGVRIVYRIIEQEVISIYQSSLKRIRSTS